jgi:23S rRNA (adenine2503-C2)-methyltransferase
VLDTTGSLEPLGQTLHEFARWRGTSVHAARAVYGRVMRAGDGLNVPPVTQHEQHGGVMKFCLPVAHSGGTTLKTESVLIPMCSYRGATWWTLCVSSQVGCRMGCTFCETGRMGLLRNLSAREIVQQFVVARRLLADTGGIRNVVFMGMGEPFDNFDAVTQAVRVFSDPHGINLPHSRITISTAGRVDGIRRLAALGWPNLHLAISLNAPSDTLRSELMPLNRATPLAELQRALLDYPLPRRGRFLVEYVLLRGINDTPEHAEQVAAWCRPLRCTVNVIPYNPQRDALYETPADHDVIEFVLQLKRCGIFAKRRVTHGRDLMGACGQLGSSTAITIAQPLV